jgi:hypothetical protein
MARMARRTGSAMAYPTEKEVRMPRFRKARTWARKAFADPALLFTALQDTASKEWPVLRK